MSAKKWEVVAGPAEDLIPPFMSDGHRHVVGHEQLSPLQEKLVVSEGGQRLYTHEAPEGWLIDHARMSGKWLAVVEHDEDSGDFSVWLYTPGGDRERVTDAAAGPDRHLIPQISLSPERLLWTQTAGDGRSCVNVRTFEEPTTSTLRCADDGYTVMWPHLSASVATWAEVDDDSGCSQLRRLRLGGEERPESFGPPCEGFQGVAAPQFHVWVRAALDSPSLANADIYGQVVGTDEVVSLGEGSAGSLVVCEGRVLWTHQGRDTSEVRSWQPDEEVKVIYESPKDKYPTTAPMCSDGNVTIGRSYTGAGAMTQEALTHDLTN